MYLLGSSDVPSDWPSYTDLKGYRWRLDNAGYWWLFNGGTLWQRADELSSTQICGVQVPPGILREHQDWLASSAITTPNKLRGDMGMTALEQNIISSFGIPPLGYLDGAVTREAKRMRGDQTCTGRNPCPQHLHLLALGKLIPKHQTEPAPAPEPVVPNIPPDFMEIPLGEDCCAVCHLNDGPLYEGDLCRYCWMLTNVPDQIQATSPIFSRPRGLGPIQIRQDPVRIDWSRTVKEVAFMVFLLALLTACIYTFI